MPMLWFQLLYICADSRVGDALPLRNMGWVREKIAATVQAWRRLILFALAAREGTVAAIPSQAFLAHICNASTTLLTLNV